jgi:hypothetical protein
MPEHEKRSKMAEDETACRCSTKPGEAGHKSGEKKEEERRSSKKGGM